MTDEETQLMLAHRKLLTPDERREYPGDNIMLEAAFQFALLGLDDQKLADVLAGGDKEALHEWCRNRPVLAASIERGRLYADAEVAASLFNRAKGYELKDTRKRFIVKEDGSTKLVGYEERTQHVPANVDAIELWLKTRQPQAWPLKPVQPEDLLPGEPEANEDDVADIIRRLERLRDRKQQGPGGGQPDPEGPVD